MTRRWISEVPFGRPLPELVDAFGDDVERMLSFLAEAQPWLDEATNDRHRAAFADISHSIARVLGERQSVAVRSAMPSWLEHLIGYWVSMDSTVITFNQDVLLETAAAPLLTGGASWNDLYRIPVVPAGQRTGAVWTSGRQADFALLKLHGSVTWYWSGLREGPSDVIFDAGVRGGWGLHGLASPYEQHIHVLMADKVPMIVPPTAIKSRFYENRTLGAAWYLAAQALKAADELVVIGYSLPPSDVVVRSLLTTNFRGSAVLPVDRSDAVIPRFAELFGDRVIPNYAGSDDAVDRFVRTFCM